MTARQPSPFRDRLCLARTMIARRPATAPIHLRDQLAAAGRDVRQLHDRLGAVLPMIEPERHWRQRMDTVPSDETRAVLLAALLGCTAICLHLRRGGPRPAIARLALHRVDCQRCVATLYRPPEGEDSLCDVCGAPEVLTFYPFGVRSGPVLLVGDACGDCAAVLGILQEVSA